MRKIVFIISTIFCLMILSSCFNQEHKPTLTKEEVVDKFTLPTEVSDDIDLPNIYNSDNFDFKVIWTTSNTKAISTKGKVTRDIFDIDVTLCGTFYYNDEIVKEKIFNIKVLKYSNQERIEQELNNGPIKKFLDSLTISYKTVLPTNTSDKDIIVSWSSNVDDLIDNNIITKKVEEYKSIELMLELSLNDYIFKEKYVMEVIKVNSYIDTNDLTRVHTIDDFKNGVLDNLSIEDNKYLVCNSNKGSYTSPIYNTKDFTELVGSWSAVTNSETGSVELEYKVLINGTWSEYLSYGKWCFSAKNASESKTSSDKLIRMNTDILEVLSNKKANAYQYRVTFEVPVGKSSPKLRCIGTALDFDLSDDTIKTSLTEVKYLVPKLNQNVVPGIGNSICSPTSATMLLKYLGHEFTNQGFNFEHEYIARNAYDNGDKIFGNWAFCVATIGSFDEFAYIKRFRGCNDLINHLSNIGPVALSVKGNMQNYYNTNGHLLVCTGYKIVDGKYIFICNDPNIKDVEIEYTYETIKNVWRNIAYVVEKR